MPEFVRVAKEADLPAGSSKEVEVQGRLVALFNVGGKILALDGVCPHAGGPLGEGTVEGNVVTCPWHGWQYDVTSGKVTMNPAVGVETYPVEIRGEDIFVDCG